MKSYRKLLNSLFLSLGLTVLLLSSCVSPKDTNMLQQTDPVYPTKEMEQYRLRVNDEIYCTILTSDTEFATVFNGIITPAGQASGGDINYNNNQDSRSSYVIYENGNISIPYFGEIKVVGMTLAEAEKRIQREMRKSFPDAQVRAKLKNNIFYVVSSGKNGIYGVYKDNMTIYQALAISGNISSDIDLSQVKIVRTTNNGRDIVKTFNLKTESVIESEFYYIQPNDVIYYTTSKSSFFKAGSLTSFIGVITGPLLLIAGIISLFN